MEKVALHIIARISTPFGEKFGVPRQSGLVDTAAKIIFEPQFRSVEAVRGLEGFSHLWLLWQFDRNGEKWSPTVRPPRLGGNRRLGVFATRSPFRPNPIGLSCVELEKVDFDDPDGPVLHVRGADLVDGTPIFDIKPYVPYCDARPEAKGGFTDGLASAELALDFPPALLEKVPQDKRDGLCATLRADPRPRYQDDPERVYGLVFGGQNVRFRVIEGVVTVVEVEKA